MHDHDHPLPATAVYASAWLGGAVIDFATSSVGAQLGLIVLAFAFRQVEAWLACRRDEARSGRVARLATLAAENEKLRTLLCDGGGPA